MTAPEAMTYDSLVTDIEGYNERTRDAAFVAQVPRIIMLAENKLATEVRTLGFKKYVSGTFNASDPNLAKPERWRESESFSFIDTTVTPNKRRFLKYREYEYCRYYWPDSSQSGVPKFYADYDYEHFFFAATPSAAFAFELSFYERPVPLSPTQQTNWTTQYAPQLLFYACLLEAQPYLKNYDIASQVQPLYDRALAGIIHEDQRREQDGAATRSKG